MPKDHIELIARGLILADNRVLLCRNRAHNYHYLPGGHIDFGEPAAEALTREIREELGRACRVGPLLLAEEQIFTQNDRQRHELNLVFHVEHLDDADPDRPIESAEDHLAFDWVDLAGVASADLRPASMRAWLASGGRLDEAPAAGWLPARG